MGMGQTRDRQGMGKEWQGMGKGWVRDRQSLVKGWQGTSKGQAKFRKESGKLKARIFH